MPRTEWRRSADAGAVADDDRGQDRAVGQERRRRRSRPATCSPRSRPTRRPWRSRRSMKAVLAKILIPEGTDGVAVNTPIALTACGEGEDSRQAAETPEVADDTTAERRAPKVDGRGRSEADRCRSRHARRAQQGRTAGQRRRQICRKDRHDDRARGAARRNGRRDAARRQGLLHRRGGRANTRAPTRSARACCRNSGRARHRHADHRARFRRARGRRRLRRAEADRRVHDLQFRHAGDRPDHQLGRQDALYVGRPDGLPDRVPRAERRRRRASPPSIRSAMRAGTRTCRASRSWRPIPAPTPRAC